MQSTTPTPAIEPFCSRCHAQFTPFVGEALALTFASHAACGGSRGPSGLAQARKSRKRRACRFSKRRKCCIKKAHSLHIDCDCRVYLVIEKNNKSYVYNSDPHNPLWPPSPVHLAQAYPVPEFFSPASFPEKPAT